MGLCGRVCGGLVGDGIHADEIEPTVRVQLLLQSEARESPIIVHIRMGSNEYRRFIRMNNRWKKRSTASREATSSAQQ